MFDYKLGILGCGTMGGIILKAIVNDNIVPFEKLIIYDISRELTEKYSKELNVNVAFDEMDLFLRSEYTLIAIKPQVLPNAMSKIKSELINVKNSEQLIDKKIILSIVAGIPISFYEERFGKKISVVRIMPNILALVNKAASALTYNKNIDKKDFDFVRSIFDKIGETVEVKEDLMDIVTGLSGSGPAFIAVLIEALADGAVKMGMPRDIAYKLAAQTTAGTGIMLLKTKMHPGVMKDMVSSPGGTTIVGLHALEKHNFRNTVISAVEAATLRSKELKEKENN